MCAGDLQESGGHSGGTPRCLQQPCASQREPSVPPGLRVCRMYNTYMSASTVCVRACMCACRCICKGLCAVGRMSRQNDQTLCMDSQHESLTNRVKKNILNKEQRTPLTIPQAYHVLVLQCSSALGMVCDVDFPLSALLLLV